VHLFFPNSCGFLSKTLPMLGRAPQSFRIFDFFLSEFSADPSNLVHALRLHCNFRRNAKPCVSTSCFASQLTCLIIFLRKWIIHKVGLSPTRLTKFIWAHRSVACYANILFSIIYLKLTSLSLVSMLSFCGLVLFQ